MKVLHLPTNIASQISVSVRALRNIGVDARGLVKTNYAIHDSTGIEFLPEKSSTNTIMQHLKRKYLLCRSVLSAIQWADVIHWHSNGPILPLELDFLYLKVQKKPCIVEFWGNDIRIPDLALLDNPYLADFYELDLKQAKSRCQKSLRVQKAFARCGFACLIPDGEMGTYVDSHLWKSLYRTRQRILISELTPNYPDPFQMRPLIVHAPSNKGKKGTDHILKAIDCLKAHYNFDFQLIHGVEHHKALEMIGKADIVIDQIIFGAHGLLALESMALGKPTICYIKPSLTATYPEDLPIINANPDTIVNALADLLKDNANRNRIGRASRAYVEKYHDAHKVARGLVEIYEGMLKKCKKS